MRFRTKIVLHFRVPDVFTIPSKRKRGTGIWAALFAGFGDRVITKDHTDRIGKIVEAFVQPIELEFRKFDVRTRGGWELPRRFFPSGACLVVCPKVLRKWEWDRSKPYPRSFIGKTKVRK